MNVEIVARGFDLPDAARQAIDAQLVRLADVGLELIEATVTLEQRRNQYLAEINLFGRRISFHAETQIEADSVSAAIDAVIDKAEKQLRRHKDRADERRRRGRDDARATEMAVPDPSVAALDGDMSIIPMPESFEAKPMSVDEAAMQLNLSKNNFIVFRNADNSDVNVLFKKRNGTFGWIYPE